MFSFARFVLPLIVLAIPLGVFGQPPLFGEVQKQTDLERRVYQKLGKNDLQGAMAILDKEIAEAKDPFEAYNLRATLQLTRRDDVDAALADLGKAIESQPTNIEPRARRARIRANRKNDPQGALEDYNAALKINPNSFELLSGRAEVNKDLKLLSDALTDLEALIALRPDHVESHIRKSNLITLRSSPESGIAYLESFLKDFASRRNGKLPKVRGERVIKKIPKDLTDKGVTVTRYSQRNMSANSPADLNRLAQELNLARSLGRAYLTLGQEYTRLNRLDPALNALTVAVDFDPNQEHAYATRGLIYLTQNKPKEAIEELSDAIDIADEPHFYLNRGVAYLLLSQEKKAEKDFEKLLKLAPESKAMIESRSAEARDQRKLLSTPK